MPAASQRAILNTLHEQEVEKWWGGVPMARYLAYLRQRNLRPTYVDAQSRTLRRAQRFLDPLTLFDAQNVDLVAYLDSHDQAPGSRATEIAHLRSFYKWATEENLVQVDPARRLVKPKQRRALPRPIPDDLIRHALAHAPDDVAPILYLALYAGLRACEIAQLRAEDISTNPPILFITESKGGGMSSVPLSPILEQALTRFPLPRRGWLFPRLDGKPGHHSRVRIGQLANNYLHDVGIDQTLHQWRHAYGSHLQRLTGNLRITQELMRHANPASTAIYTYVNPTETAAAVARIPSFDQPTETRHLRLL